MSGSADTQASLNLTALLAGVSAKVIVPLNAEAARAESTAPAFYCVHAITGAGVTDFAGLANAMGDAVRFFAIRAPKALMLASDYNSLLTSIAGQYAAAIMKSQPAGAIFLGGWSSGAIVALETARQLQDCGRNVGLLVSIDGAPKNTAVAASSLTYLAKWIENLPAAVKHDDIRRLYRQFVFKIGGRFSKPAGGAADSDIAHPVRETIENFKSYPAHQRRFMRTLYDTIERTSFDEFRGSVVVYKAAIQPIFLSGVAEFWRRVAPDCEIVDVHGTHANLVLDPAARAIAGDIAKRLVEAQSRSGDSSSRRRPAAA